MASDDEDDLYNDLANSKLAASGSGGAVVVKPAAGQELVSGKSTRKTVSLYPLSAVSERPKSLVEEVEALQQRVKGLENENSVLKRNIGTLYRTAIAEIKRKDAEIERLQSQRT